MVQMSQDNSIDENITRDPKDYLAPIAGTIPHLLLIGVYLIAGLLVFTIIQNSSK